MAKYKVVLTGLKQTGEAAMTEFIGRFAQAYKTTPDKARELIRAKQNVIYTLDDQGKAEKAKAFLESLGATVKIESDPPPAEQFPPPPVDAGEPEPARPAVTIKPVEEPPPEPAAPPPAPAASAVGVPMIDDDGPGAAPKSPPAGPPPIPPAEAAPPPPPPPPDRSAQLPSPPPPPVRSAPPPPRPAVPRGPVSSPRVSSPPPPAGKERPPWMVPLIAGVVALVVVGGAILLYHRFGYILEGAYVVDTIAWPEDAGYKKIPTHRPEFGEKIPAENSSLEIIDRDGTDFLVKGPQGEKTMNPVDLVGIGTIIVNHLDTEPSISINDHNGDECVLPLGLTVQVDGYGQFAPTAFTPMIVQAKKPKASEPPNLRTISPMCGTPLNLWSKDPAANRRDFDLMDLRKRALQPYDNPDSYVYVTRRLYKLEDGDEFNHMIVGLTCYMGFIFDGGYINRERREFIQRRFESIKPEQAERWQEALKPHGAKGLSLPLVQWALCAMDPIFENDFYAPDLAQKYLRRLQQVSSDDVDLWVRILPAFAQARYDAAMTIASIDYFFPEEKFNQQAFHDVLTGKITAAVNFPLHDAAKKGNAEKVKQLAAQGVDLNQRDDLGYTALEYAAVLGNLNMVKLLIESGADVNGRSNNGNTALIYAIIKQRKPVIDYLLSLGPDVNARNGDHENALMYAAYMGDTDTVKALLGLGAAPIMKNKRGQTVVDYARTKGHDQIADLVLQDVPARKWIVGRWVSTDKRFKVHLTFTEDGKFTVGGYGILLSGTYNFINVDQIQVHFKIDTKVNQLAWSDQSIFRIKPDFIAFYADPDNTTHPTAAYRRAKDNE